MSTPTKRTKPSGSMSRPERFNLRLNAPAWARTGKLFAKVLAARPDLPTKADAWEAVFLPLLENFVKTLPLPKRDRDIPGQATLFAR